MSKEPVRQGAGSVVALVTGSLATIYQNEIGVPVLWAIFILSALILIWAWDGLRRLRAGFTAFIYGGRRFPSLSQDRIYSKTFQNETVDIDGKNFIDCQFTNVRLTFHGNAPFTFSGSTKIYGECYLETDNAAAKEFAGFNQYLRKYIYERDGGKGAVFQSGERDPSGQMKIRTREFVVPQSSNKEDEKKK